ncbi:hypothetical protein LWI29_017862 [Acer saccharum]|uniref:Protein kinase domain-containing protein n=1 Tax=Acer saccharum TaxID=4024 RepID=A0AA39ST55_ACESA|nr:hypothetical protein LWI29_017862 [Acer saccharum]
MVDRQPSFLVLQLCLVLVSVIITVRNSKLAGAYGEHAKRKLQYQADSSGFINIDCGASESYTDRETGLVYELDTKYIDTGKTHEIDPDFLSATYHRQQRHNLRFFPEGKRNCYTLKPIQGGKNNYLIRAVFEYGNYDGKNQTPGFDLYLGVNNWTRMSSAMGMREIIHVPSDAYIDVCLVNTGNGVPYISALELRPLDNSLYRIPNGALQNIYSLDLGGNNDIRYPEDVFDRYWDPYNEGNWSVMSTESALQSSADGSNYKVPDKLLQTAAASKSASVPLSLVIERGSDPNSTCYIYFHFAEIEILDNGSNRELQIEVHGVRNLSSEPVTLEYLMPMTKTSTGLPMSADEEISFKIYASEGSNLPPILNAVEVFLYIELPDSPTNFNDAVVVLGKSESKSENKNDTFAAKNQQFTYSDIVKITKNFEKVLGKGGFGTVYLGYLDDTEVAVKLLSSSSAQGYKEFHSEVKLLMRVHHRNLTSLVGYCIEGTHMGIIYEYMANGSLDQYFSGKHEGKNASILSWEDRMRIAVDAAQGLEYLHDGCKPPIIHRDVKSSNILLNEKLEAKIADFGVSRIFPIESGSHVCTGVVGTAGYLDPEYCSSNRLNEKSDIYSFGVILLEIITSRPVILTALENTHISKWVNSMLAEGDIRSIVDPKLSGDFEINSAWKAVELALSCTSQSSSERPTMIEVVMELKECLVLAMTPNGEGHPGNKSKGPRRMLSVDVNADEFSPSAR